MPSAVVVSHQGIAHELGHLDPWLEKHSFTVTRIYREDPRALPKADLLIVMGSPDSVAGEVCTPASRAEIDTARDWVAEGRPYLGICFGAQVLATALGGSVARMPVPFSGYVTLDSTHGETMRGPWLVWHNDGITAPATSELLAALDHADLAFRHKNAWGLQPHIEVTPETLERMLIALDVDESDYAPVVQLLREDRTNPARAAAVLDAFWTDVN